MIPGGRRRPGLFRQVVDVAKLARELDEQRANPCGFTWHGVQAGHLHECSRPVDHKRDWHGCDCGALSRVVEPL